MSEPFERAPNLRGGASWIDQPERGSVWIFRAVAALSLRCGRRASRALLHLIAAYYFLFSPAAARNSKRYLRRALARTATARDRYAHLLCFATILHDRLYLLNDRFSMFDIEVSGSELLERVTSAGSGCLLMGAHLGSFEIARAVGRQIPGISAVMAMYAENARKVNAVLSALDLRVKPEIIRLGTIDAMLQIRTRLDEGAFVGVLGDRTIGHEPFLWIDFLGSPAPFPVGPWRAAAVLRRPVLFIAGLYCGANRYRLVIDPVADFTSIPAEDRDAAIHSAIKRYAALLEGYCRTHPYNWFNFFDFWQEAPETVHG
jgi:predicted LPLAT superfamily acyltransferase